jgi:hypothetical protein
MAIFLPVFVFTVVVFAVVAALTYLTDRSAERHERGRNAG